MQKVTLSRFTVKRERERERESNMVARKKNQKKSCSKENIKKQIDDLEEISRSRSRRCYFATCEDEKLKSLCQWLHRVFYEKIDVDSKTRKQLPATLCNRQVKQAIRLLTQSENDLVFKRQVLMHRDCITHLYPFLFKYLVPGLRKKLKKTLMEIEKST